MHEIYTHAPKSKNASLESVGKKKKIHQLYVELKNKFRNNQGKENLIHLNQVMNMDLSIHLMRILTFPIGSKIRKADSKQPVSNASKI